MPLSYNLYYKISRSFLKVFDMYMKNEDRLAFLTFNDNVDVEFEITELGMNKVEFTNIICRSF
jgi:hypothetical protein